MSLEKLTTAVGVKVIWKIDVIDWYTKFQKLSGFK